MAIPTVSALNVMSLHGGITQNDIFNTTSKDVAIMGKASGKRRSIEEHERRTVLAHLQTLLEGIDAPPEFQNSFLFSRKIKPLCKNKGLEKFEKLARPIPGAAAVSLIADD